MDEVVFMDMLFMMAPSYLEMKAVSSLSGRRFVFCIRKRKEGHEVVFKLTWPIVLRERVSWSGVLLRRFLGGSCKGNITLSE